jgi:molecular chaperone DnaK (HSP70)
MEALSLWDESNTVQERIVYNDKALFDFGIGLTNYTFDSLITIGESLPKRVEKVYSTEKDDQKTLQIRAFQRKQGYEKATKTHDKGIEFVDEILIYNLPPAKVGDLKIKVIFELTKDDILAMAVHVSDKNGNEIESKDVKIKKVSEEY